ncbi:Fmo1p [Sugiyamaella lignohabitans]|uniref:Fmo1p n=1 Tax=Sugiyamaella lignohabitans TaxID=796027 RepID=A0A167E9M3_9ASCO|nr:Fmo1p [Sugiyamaella lignohabitans]ANB13810.1 Fmo1p [Sugiyamaella lignohabitans]
MNVKRIAIIGAGPAGAAGLDSFLSHGFTDIRVFERRPLPGGTWVGDTELGFASNTGNTVPPIDDEVGDVPVEIPPEAASATEESPYVRKATIKARRFDEPTLYSQLETNILPELMSFKRRSMPKNLLSNSVSKYENEDVFRSYKTIQEYVGEFFTGENEKYVSYNTSVEQAEQPDGPGTKWVLTLKRQNGQNNNEEWWTEEFDGVYAASGRYNVPRVSHINGLDEVAKAVPQGVIEHTKWFRGAESYKGKKVLIVGASVSTTDIIQLVKETAQLPLYLSVRHVAPAYRAGFEQPFVDGRGSITSVSLNESGKSIDVIFEDGSTVTNIEKLVLATGYNFSYPYLEKYTQKFGGIVRNNVLHNVFLTTWWSEDPTLVLPGVFTEGINFRCMETQAMATAALWSGFPGSGFPSKEICVQWEADRRKFKTPAQWHFWFPHFDNIIEAIAKVGGGYKALCEFAGITSSDLKTFVPVYEKGIAFKCLFFTKVANEYMLKHPKTLQQYNQTVALLKTKTVEPDPTAAEADHELFKRLFVNWSGGRGEPKIPSKIQTTELSEKTPVVTEVAVK